MQSRRLRSVYRQRNWPLLAPVGKIMALGRKITALVPSFFRMGGRASLFASSRETYLKISSCPFWDTCTYEGLTWIPNYMLAEKPLEKFHWSLATIKHWALCIAVQDLTTRKLLKLHRVGTDSLWNRMKISCLKFHMYKARAPRASLLRMLHPWLSLHRSKHRYFEIFHFMQFRRAIYAISEYAISEVRVNFGLWFI